MVTSKHYLVFHQSITLTTCEYRHTDDAEAVYFHQHIKPHLCTEVSRGLL